MIRPPRYCGIFADEQYALLFDNTSQGRRVFLGMSLLDPTMTAALSNSLLLLARAFGSGSAAGLHVVPTEKVRCQTTLPLRELVQLDEVRLSREAAGLENNSSQLDEMLEQARDAARLIELGVDDSAAHE